MKFYMFVITNDNGRTVRREVTDLTTRQQNAAAQKMANELQRPVMLQNQTAKRIGPYTDTMNHGLFNPTLRSKAQAEKRLMDEYTSAAGCERFKLSTRTGR